MKSSYRLAKYPNKQMFIVHLVSNPHVLFPLFILILIALSSFGAPLIATHVLHSSPTDQELSNTLSPWFYDNHVLGTDNLGRDVLTRVLYAGRVSLTIGFTVMFVQMIVGVPLGLFAGYYGGWVDDTINVLLQIVRSIPIFFLLLVLSVLFRPSPLGLAGMLGILGWTNTARQVRAIVLSVKNQDYVDAARALGANDYRILLRHILPNLSSIILVIAGFDIASAILTEAGLSFLGFGVQPPVPSWGNMLSDALENARSAPWLVVTPGAFITTTVFCIFLFSDGLRDALDPRLEG